MKKSIIAATLITITLGSGLAIASKDKGDCERGHRGGMMKHLAGDFTGGLGAKHNPKEMLARTFNSEEIRTLAEARLLMAGNKNIKVGDIDKVKDGYTVQIVTQDNSLVKQIELAPNGLPKEIFERIQKKIAAHNQ